jgi:hypothetical protein
MGGPSKFGVQASNDDTYPGEVIPRRFLGNFAADFCSDDLLTLSTPPPPPPPPQLTQF